ncbi:MAG: hypothetical protein IAF02_09485, partial [Anaerolineae bacterium]|nr:hypothetical protein [Anaerolineae bacterium]
MKLLLDTHTFLWFIAGDSQLSYQARQLVVRGYLMSRSRKKRPFSSITTAKTEKQEKRLANRRVRRVNKSLLAGTH